MSKLDDNEGKCKAAFDDIDKAPEEEKSSFKEHKEPEANLNPPSPGIDGGTYVEYSVAQSDYRQHLAQERRNEDARNEAEWNALSEEQRQAKRDAINANREKQDKTLGELFKEEMEQKAPEDKASSLDNTDVEQAAEQKHVERAELEETKAEELETQYEENQDTDAFTEISIEEQQANHDPELELAVTEIEAEWEQEAAAPEPSLYDESLDILEQQKEQELERRQEELNQLPEEEREEALGELHDRYDSYKAAFETRPGSSDLEKYVPEQEMDHYYGYGDMDLGGEGSSYDGDDFGHGENSGDDHSL